MIILEPKKDESASFTSYINIIDQENNYNNSNQKMKIDSNNTNDIDLKK